LPEPATIVTAKQVARVENAVWTANRYVMQRIDSDFFEDDKIATAVTTEKGGK
jgi:hypothetical protein